MRLLVIIISLLAVAVICYISSEQIMLGYSDCSMLHTLGSWPENCASNLRMLSQRLFQYAALAFFLLSGAIPVFIERRRQKNLDEKIDSILQ